LARKKTDDSPKPLSRLTTPRSDAHERIANRITKGLEIRNIPIRTQEELDAAEAERNKWDSYNIELLNRIFDSSALADEYSAFGGSFIPGNAGLQWWVNHFREDVTQKITRLEAIAGRLDLIPSPSDVSNQPPAVRSPSAYREVFVVHGHDEAAKETTARFLEMLGLKPVILHEQPSQGRTIIEKFERHADVAFAVVLLTPDDIGASKTRPEDQQSRARQNVVFELGYFTGKLGRSKVCALYKEGLELPSDYQGVLYVQMTADGGWQLRLAKELKAAGIDVDLNRAI
jgi:predicted nucleotide-binding protein